ncbi:MAG: methyltransferase domain-containing protein [Ignavibacteriaceae bacterium]|nr:methyltransferase domain-containing protein [Ignavibacteriaceae bacterium]HRN27604.1 class I SAM-dependent methyltransferase [Ignavibacteriaceae bacterium]HRP92934.1 class I SAM-dependent methyltransferase [Ignavibacteriaceae bacterium]HRQ55005.1 class I SAM-dependent methyltransferase [Ignavibacteriaceae bacterium]
MKCRFCSSENLNLFIDLGMSPPSNSFLTVEQLNNPEVFLPLKLWICNDCFLVQIDEYKNANEIFNNDYAYFSSYSTTWLNHSKNYVDMISKRLNLNCDSFVIEIASNDGYLLQYFKEKNIPCLGIEPTANTAKVAKEKGISTLTEYFTNSMAKQVAIEFGKADLILGNNVFAHVPDINDFVKGLKVLLKGSGTITLEFPHLLTLIENNQYDTIYHEHFWYFSVYSLQNVFRKHELTIYNIEELSTHGGSLRLYLKHFENSFISVLKNVQDVINNEIKHGINKLDYYQEFVNRVRKNKLDILEFLIRQKKDGKKIAAYGAAAKGNTFLNYCGIKNDLIDFVVDASPIKQNKLLPGSHIPIVSEKVLHLEKPDYVLIFPWNIKDEIFIQINYIKNWGGKFVVAIPNLEILG